MRREHNKRTEQERTGNGERGMHGITDYQCGWGDAKQAMMNKIELVEERCVMVDLPCVELYIDPVRREWTVDCGKR
jgi:hypothetical protein